MVLPSTAPLSWSLVSNDVLKGYIIRSENASHL